MYIHRHGLQTPATRPTGFRQEGPSEVYNLCNQLATMVIGETSETEDREVVTMKNLIDGREYTVPIKKLYSRRPHITADNHFSGENVMSFMGENGFGMTCTCRRDRFPPGLKRYFNHEKVVSTDKRTRVARFEQPIFAVNRVQAKDDKKPYTRTMVSFQSTGATNIAGVNNLLSLTLFVQPKFRGAKKNKFAWATEQNEGRAVYLNHYHGVDSMDHMIKNTGNYFISWKYWHSPYLHAMSMGVIAAFDMYLECSEGLLDAAWMVAKKDRMSFSQFRLRLSEQMLQYDPRNDLYAGDEKFRRTTQMHKMRRKGSKDFSAEEFPETGVTLANLRAAGKRICVTMEHTQKHFDTIIKKSNAGPCEICGLSTYWMCMTCGKHMCLLNKRNWNGAKCAFLFHSEKFFGLSRSDYLDVLGKGWENGKKKKNDDIRREMESWKPATEAAMERHARFIARLNAQDVREESATTSGSTCNT